MNDLEICVVALKRSGHHAIVEWLLRHLEGEGCYLNDCKVGVSPYERAASAVPQAGAVYAQAAGAIELEAERPGSFCRKDYLVHSYENTSLAKLYSREQLARWDEFVGPSQRRVHLVTLRDPFNNFASLVRWTRSESYDQDSKMLARAVRRWKEYAREFLGRTNIVPGEKVAVSYNAWFTDRGYREALAARLGLEFTDEGLDRVGRWGPTQGSSFDGASYDGRAQEMPVLERFRAYETDAVYLGLFDPEIIELSKEIFGELPGTEAVVAAATRSPRRRRPRMGRPLAN